MRFRLIAANHSDDNETAAYGEVGKARVEDRATDRLIDDVDANKHTNTQTQNEKR